MKRIACWEPIPYLRKDLVRLPPGQSKADLYYYRCTHCLKTANGYRTPFCPWCGYEMHELYEKEEIEHAVL